MPALSMRQRAASAMICCPSAERISGLRLPMVRDFLVGKAAVPEHLESGCALMRPDCFGGFARHRFFKGVVIRRCPTPETRRRGAVAVACAFVGLLYDCLRIGYLSFNVRVRGWITDLQRLQSAGILARWHPLQFRARYYGRHCKGRVLLRPLRGIIDGRLDAHEVGDSLLLDSGQHFRILQRGPHFRVNAIDRRILRLLRLRLLQDLQHFRCRLLQPGLLRFCAPGAIRRARIPAPRRFRRLIAHCDPSRQRPPRLRDSRPGLLRRGLTLQFCFQAAACLASARNTAAR